MLRFLWDFPIQTDKNLDHNRPDITMIDKRNKVCWLIDVACPFDTRINFLFSFITALRRIVRKRDLYLSRSESFVRKNYTNN